MTGLIQTAKLREVKLDDKVYELRWAHGETASEQRPAYDVTLLFTDYGDDAHPMATDNELVGVRYRDGDGDLCELLFPTTPPDQFHACTLIDDPDDLRVKRSKREAQEELRRYQRDHAEESSGESAQPQG